MVFWRRSSRRAAPGDPFGGLPKPSCVERLYVVGDVHGRSDLARRLIEAIGADWRACSAERFRVVFVGDYVDRGDDSAGVIESVLALSDEAARSGGAVTALKGNHEAFLLDFLDAPETGADWLRYGGLQTLASYRIAPPTPGDDADAWADCADRLAAAMGPHVDFLAGLPLAHRDGNVFICHAAIDVDAPLERQPERALLWGDDRFLSQGGPDGVVVVHGHTISETIDVGRNRIGVDTGAFASGRLTALVIDAVDGFGVLST